MRPMYMTTDRQRHKQSDAPSIDSASVSAAFVLVDRRVAAVRLLVT